MLKIKEIFASIQSEGPFAGRPAIFVRFGNCNLSCSFCDTDFTTDVQEMSNKEIVKSVARIKKEALSGASLIVITGGEPFAQDFRELTFELMSQYPDVQIETNGTIYQLGFPYFGVTTVVSPKKEKSMSPEYIRIADCFKFVLREKEVPEAAQLAHKRIFIQPMDEQDPDKNARNQAWCVHLAQLKDWALSLQLHKILNIE